MLIACFGIHKSASTFAYRLATAISKELAEGDTQTTGDVQKINAHFLDANDAMIKSPCDVLVQKTHAGTNVDLSGLIGAGHILPIISIRDLRDVALSMLDSGRDERVAGRSSMISRVHTVDDAIEQIASDVAATNRWGALSGTSMLIPYSKITQDPMGTVYEMGQFLFSTQLPPDRCEDILAGLTKKSIRFNKGVHHRYLTEMSEVDSTRILERFSDFYEKYGDML